MGLTGRVSVIYGSIATTIKLFGVAVVFVAVFPLFGTCQTPTVNIPQASPVPTPTAFPTPIPTPYPTPLPVPSPINPFDVVRPLTLTEAVDLALLQASSYKAAQINELIAGEDVKQARAAFLPKVAAPLNFIYTSPSIGPTRPRPPSFLGANAITEYQALLNAAGEIDTSGKLRATLLKNQALVESARAGTEIARRELTQAVAEAYFNLSLATTKRRGAESNLSAALDFENNTRLNLE